ALSERTLPLLLRVTRGSLWGPPLPAQVHRVAAGAVHRRRAARVSLCARRARRPGGGRVLAADRLVAGASRSRGLALRTPPPGLREGVGGVGPLVRAAGRAGMEAAARRLRRRSSGDRCRPVAGDPLRRRPLRSAPVRRRGARALRASV